MPEYVMYRRTQKMLLAGLLTVLLPHQSFANCVNGVGSASASTPDNRFTTDNVTGTVTDIKTGLMWKRCSEGQTWDSGAKACSGVSASYVNWQDALASAQSNNFAGQIDWRLPNIKELASILERACVIPAINSVIFPATPPQFYWTSSPSLHPGYAQNSSVWGVDFGVGVSTPISDETTGYYPVHVRLVRKL
jgi:Protein of unknown function (DUF1566)